MDNGSKIRLVLDVCTLSGLAGSALWVIFGVGASVDKNTVEIDHNRQAIERVEADRKVKDEEIVGLIKEVKTEQKAAREEDRRSQEKINDKLDRLIERELSR